MHTTQYPAAEMAAGGAAPAALEAIVACRDQHDTTDQLCPCGSPRQHLALPVDSPGWACQVPAYHPLTGLILKAVCTDTGERQHRRCQSTNAAGSAQCISPAGHTEPTGELAHMGRTGQGSIDAW